MKRRLVLISMIACSIAFAQNSNKELNEIHQQLGKQQKQTRSDSTKMDTPESFYEQQSKRTDSLDNITHQEQFDRNMDGFYNEIKEREQKEKRNMWLRLGFGIILAAVGIYGVMRKKKSVK